MKTTIEYYFEQIHRLSKVSLRHMVVLGCFSLFSSFSIAQTVKVGLRINAPKMYKDEVRITVVRNGAQIAYIEGKHNNSILLDFDADYVIRLTCHNCLPKEFVISTKNVPQHMKYELLDFSFEATLLTTDRPIESGNIERVAAYWFYHVDNGEFDYQRSDYENLNCFLQAHPIVDREL